MKYLIENKRILEYNVYVVGTIHSLQRFSPGYHRDNILITKGCIGRRIGIPQRIRVTTWNQKHINYTKCVKSNRVGMTVKSAGALENKGKSKPKKGDWQRFGNI